MNKSILGYFSKPQVLGLEAIYPLTLKNGYMMVEIRVLGWGNANWIIKFDNPFFPVKSAEYFWGVFTKRVIVPVGAKLELTVSNVFGVERHLYSTRANLESYPVIEPSFHQNLNILNGEIKEQYSRLNILSAEIRGCSKAINYLWLPKIHLQAKKLRSDLRFIDRSLDNFRDFKIPKLEALRSFSGKRELYQSYQINYEQMNQDLRKFKSLAAIASMPRDANS